MSPSPDEKRRQLYPKPNFRERMRPYLWQDKLTPAFWTLASIISLSVNLILIVVLVLLGRELFALKSVVNDQLLHGLATNFEKMDNAKIVTDINVQDEIQVKFDLPVQTKTKVILTEDVTFDAPVNINTGPISLNATAEIKLPKGMRLPISLDILVPVDTTVPVNLTVPVNIPLEDTELHEPFVGLQKVVEPYQSMLDLLPNSWEEVEFCQTIPGCEQLMAPGD